MQSEEEMIDQTYNRTVLVEWGFPCRANSKIEQFQIKFKQENEEITRKIEVNETEKRISFEYKLDDLQPDNDYDIVVQAISENCTEGEKKSFKFEMKAGCKTKFDLLSFDFGFYIFSSARFFSS